MGLVLDAAIIVQENIVRLRSQGMDNHKAVLRGALQVSGALFASTATSVAIFSPYFIYGWYRRSALFRFSINAFNCCYRVHWYLLSLCFLLQVKYWLKEDTVTDPYAHYWQRLTKFVMRLTDSAIKRTSWIVFLVGGAMVVTITMLPKTDFYASCTNRWLLL